jgi:SAM-dependent methyltransferase
MTDTSTDAPRFVFGKNWENFVDKHLTEERVRIAQEHLLRFLKLPDLTGKRMLDIGCGSGLHSLAALRANVRELVSFDYDANSVATTRKLHDLSGRPAHWRIAQGSVLDKAYMDSLGSFDIVYSWVCCTTPGISGRRFATPPTALRRAGCFTSRSTPRMFSSIRPPSSGSMSSAATIAAAGSLSVI